MQSLHISTSALRGLQYALDNTANNLANMDTAGFKRRGTSFSELLADSMNEQPAADQARTSPPGLRIGNGVRVGWTALDLSQGSVKITDVPTDLMIEGEGFFMVRDPQAEPGSEYRLTRNGAFQLMQPNPDEPYMLVNSSGHVLVDENGTDIQFQSNGELSVHADGRVTINGEDTGVVIPIWRHPNPDQLIQSGKTEWLVTLPDGEVNPSFAPDLQVINVPGGNSASRIRQGALEMSNVNLSQEMTQLIAVQRAFQLNSRAIAISDQMMGIANSLRNG